jgi:2-oxoglutarate/2-oxoacid ferredoxin oxidoreductase subunit beta
MSDAAKKSDKLVKLTKKDFESDQDVRWCPGCGDYAILATVQRAMAQFGVKRENTVFISGIGCSSRFPYYMNTYGFHTIHGRAPAIASGLKITRPELEVWLITGDGDALSIGGNHLIHALRRNMDLKILMFNNQIYGLTKGQYSPTSAVGAKTASTPMGSIDLPLNPLCLALGANASFVARAADTDAKGLLDVLTRAHQHKGSAFIEILQNCPVFNDGIWEPILTKEARPLHSVTLEEGKPLLFANGTKGIRIRPDLSPEVVDVGEGEGQVPVGQLAVHHEQSSPAFAYMLASLTHPQFPVPMGVLRVENKPTYGEMAVAQVQSAIESKGSGKLKELLYSGMTWEVGADGTKH